MQIQVNFYLSHTSPCIDAGNPRPRYNDVKDPNKPGAPLFPALGEMRNDIGHCGGTPVVIYVTDVTDVKELSSTNGVLPQSYELNQNYPNPFNPTTTINYSIPLVEFGFVPTTHLAIYDILGQEVEILINKKQNPGNYEVTWNAGNLTSGVYFCRLQVGSFIETRKMILLR